MNAPHRKRRIAADEAHSWARNLRLNNPYAKLVLSMLTLYVQADGHCFVGIEALAEDTELSADTVRKRLAWLEGVGAIARFPQWIDASGRRNPDGNGKRTTDEIRLLLSADGETIERRALGDISESSETAKSAQPLDDASVSPRSQQGLNPGTAESQDSVSPLPALCQPSDSGKGLDSSNLEPEPESSPYPLPGGDGQQSGELGSEPTWPHEASWQRLKKAWDDPISSPDLCRGLWSAFTDIERERCIRAARGYLAWRLKQPKLPLRMNLQKLMRAIDSWPEYEKLAGPDPALRTFIIEGSHEFQALAVLDRIIGARAPELTFDTTQGARGWWRKLPVSADLAGLAVFEAKPFEQWSELDPGTQPFNAWADRIKHWIGAWPRALRVPCLYPPLKDGSISGTKEDSTGPPDD